VEHLAELIPQLIVAALIALYVGGKLHTLGYSGTLWAVVFFFGGVVALPLAASVPDRRVERQRKKEQALLDAQLQQARLPVLGDQAPVPRLTISEEQTHGQI
jgi:hypothetical protein